MATGMGERMPALCVGDGPFRSVLLWRSPDPDHELMLDCSAPTHPHGRRSFSLDYMVTCFGAAALDVRRRLESAWPGPHWHVHGELLRLHLRRGFSMDLAPGLSIGRPRIAGDPSLDSDRLDDEVRLACARMYREHHEGAREHYARWCGDDDVDLTTYVDPCLSEREIADVLADTRGLGWVPDTATARPGDAWGTAACGGGRATVL